MVGCFLFQPDELEGLEDVLRDVRFQLSRRKIFERKLAARVDDTTREARHPSCVHDDQALDVFYVHAQFSVTDVELQDFKKEKSHLFVAVTGFKSRYIIIKSDCFRVCVASRGEQINEPVFYFFGIRSRKRHLNRTDTVLEIIFISIAEPISDEY
tara:strand:+ start:14102 stop:14566 length:465 start_codon:yes stop_codon:yes gene_type:complete